MWSAQGATVTIGPAAVCCTLRAGTCRGFRGSSKHMHALATSALLTMQAWRDGDVQAAVRRALQLQPPQ
jgi:hypothetical protein